ncbi:MAG: hypothetical protein KA957_00975 [Syntrophaceae bacterium]|nr:hypothetical protein [Syntrophaceae bacterium]
MLADNSSGLNDGGATMVVMLAEKAQALDCDRAIANTNGPGCGLGHPTGATGFRLLVALLHAPQKRGNTLGLATLCGSGVSTAVALEIL